MVELGNLLLIIYELHYLTMTIYSDLNAHTFLESYLLIYSFLFTRNTVSCRISYLTL